MRTAVLASGSGTILEAILDASIDVVVVAVDRPCRATEIAALAGVPVEMVERSDFTPGFDRDTYTEQMLKALRVHSVDLVVLAGFGTVMPNAVADYKGRMLNTHPSLLPAFPGWRAVRDALAAGVKVTGCTVHVVTAETDVGPILAQEAVPVLPGDDENRLHERIKHVERRLYPATIRQFGEDLSLSERAYP